MRAGAGKHGRSLDVGVGFTRAAGLPTARLGSIKNQVPSGLQGILAMNQTTDVERVAAAVSATIHEHWALFLVEGILLTVLGMLAILLPAVASLAGDADLRLAATAQWRHGPG